MEKKPVLKAYFLNGHVASRQADLIIQGNKRLFVAEGSAKQGSKGFHHGGNLLVL